MRTSQIAFLFALLANLAFAESLRLNLTPLPSLSGSLSDRCFGASNGALMVAGGADGAGAVWVLPRGAETWEQHSLPQALNAAATATDGKLMYCPGAPALRWTNSGIETVAMPALPRAFESGGAAILDRTLFYVGGKTPSFGTDAQSFNDSVYILTLDQPDAWIRSETAPGFSPRTRPAVVTQAGSLFVFGGWDVNGSSLQDAWKWTPDGEWQEITEPPFALAASATYALGPTTIVHVGGDISKGPSARQPRVLVYNTLTNTWANLGESELPRVGAGIGLSSGVAMFASSGSGVRELKVSFAQLESPRQEFGVVGWSIVLAYLLVTIGIGLACFRHRDSSQFLNADFDVPWWAAAASYQASVFPVMAMLTLPAMAYVTDQRHATQYVAALIAVWLLAVHIAPILRRLGITSIFEYLESRFDARIHMAAAGVWIAGQVLLVGVSIAVAAVALSAVVGGSNAIWVLALGASVTICVALGGLRASLWSDVLQVGLILMAVGLCLAMVLMGAENASSIWRAQGKLTLYDPGFSLTEPVIWVMLVGGFFTAFTQLGDQSLMQRLLTTRGPRDCKRAMYGQYIIGLPIVACLCLGGSAVFAWQRTNPEFVMPTIDTNLLWLHIAAHQLPGLVGVLVLVALLSAAMSTADSGCHSIATVGLHDLIRRYVPDWEEATFLKLARGLVFAAGLLGTFLAGWMTLLSMDGLFTAFARIIAVFGGSIASVMVLGLVTRQAHSAGVLVGLVIGVIGTAIAVFIVPVHPALYAFFAFVLAGASGLIASFVLPSTPRNLHGLTVYTLRSDE